jgi:6-phosphogluconate dehydrogenase
MGGGSMKSDIGVIGLGVMGASLALNLERNGFSVAVYNLESEKTDQFLKNRAMEKNIVGADSLGDLIQSVEKPRKLLAMIPAGAPIDGLIDDLHGLIEPGDILIDGGNSHFMDTKRRAEKLKADGVFYFGVGVSGGEEGALWGPSIMPGGDESQYEKIAFLEKIAASVDGIPCCSYMGNDGAGHYVKMVHNGIEYGFMQMLAEVYDVMKRVGGFSNQELSHIFKNWNQGDLESFLVEISGTIFSTLDEDSEEFLVDKILDTAKQKGTGKWTSQNAFDIGVNTSIINNAVDARIISGFKELRQNVSQKFGGPQGYFDGNRSVFIDMCEKTLLFGLYVAYAQGFAMFDIADKEYGFNFKNAEIAKIWRAGCIIRSRVLNQIMAAYSETPELEHLLLNSWFADRVSKYQYLVRDFIKFAISSGIPVFAMSGALNYFDALRSERLPANLIQAQRDFFGAHTFQRIDKEGVFHHQWNTSL